MNFLLSNYLHGRMDGSNIETKNAGGNNRILETMADGRREGGKEMCVTVIGSFRNAGIKPRQRRQSFSFHSKKKKKEEVRRRRRIEETKKKSK